MDSPEERLRHYLSCFGEVNFYKGSFVGEEDIDYPTIELKTKKPIMEGLKDYFSRRFSENNGEYSAYIRFIVISQIGEGRFRYVFEIIPKEEVHPDNYHDVCDRIMKSLPHAIRDFRQKNGRR